MDFTSTRGKLHESGSAGQQRELVGLPVGRRPADHALVDELHRNDPDLIAQTRFVQPEQAQLVRLIRSRSDDAQTFRQIVNDQDDKGTANFLFVTVNDGGVTGGGADWSLLLVDRRVPAAPVAYHYDSAGSHNNTVAEQLAARLGSRLQAAGMARQQNGLIAEYFVVDAKRALIRRLSRGASGQTKPLHIEHLIRRTCPYGTNGYRCSAPVQQIAKRLPLCSFQAA
ncbi:MULTISPECIES: hypothetical protein [unclassified Bradyrhizobium]|uniref:hypothetical protein n=1 Tax=unclassified Bradyrhizobium TaxID=2631580 RepID=UPI001CD56751|nr:MULTISPECIES: hypothetical protein [unclassified Bradyrhizobium]MCA1385580.1 hypothetical protein [Bradyrhizobium sp. BRP05]MCA1393635.1 hypothetical protein [Bradyrhizobium sp. IC3123]MCA1422699.1 hypothetical protein [Bradyrhizobium sp. BRP23]MCA1429138.1 hypothetical protein [Bradyrhizobium sp. NBAIM16]MCA1471019.1 hypothetical protein [Bradyrhizobium sp. IC3195]